MKLTARTQINQADVSPDLFLHVVKTGEPDESYKAQLSQLQIALPYTYAELEALISDNLLVANTSYLITDFRTKHIIPNTDVVNTGTTEPIIVIAASENTIFNTAYSTLFPSDVILYEFVDSTTAGGDRGKIYYRKDCIKNNSRGYDWRNVKFRRWETEPDSGIFTVITDNDGAYEDFYAFANSASAASCENNDFGIITDYDIDTFGAPTDKLDNFIIGNGCANNKIGSGSFNNTIGNSLLQAKIGNHFSNNIIGNSCVDIIIGNHCIDNTIGNSFTDSTIGEDFNGNEVGNSFYFNTIGNEFISNTVGNSFFNNTIGDECDTSIFGNSFSNNAIGRSCSGNNFGNSCELNVISDFYFSNTLGNSSSGNVIGNNFNTNVFGNAFSDNKIGNRFNNNTGGNGFSSNPFIGDDFYNNTNIGNGFSYNTILNNFQNNADIGNGFENNQVGNDFANNTIGNGAAHNTIGDGFDTNEVGAGFSNNKIAYGFTGNTTGTDFQGNNFGINCTSNIIGDGLNNSQFPADFSSNTITATSFSSCIIKNSTLNITDGDFLRTEFNGCDVTVSSSGYFGDSYLEGTIVVDTTDGGVYQRMHILGITTSFSDSGGNNFSDLRSFLSNWTVTGTGLSFQKAEVNNSTVTITLVDGSTVFDKAILNNATLSVTGSTSASFSSASIIIKDSTLTISTLLSSSSLDCRFCEFVNNSAVTFNDSGSFSIACGACSFNKTVMRIAGTSALAQLHFYRYTAGSNDLINGTIGAMAAATY